MTTDTAAPQTLRECIEAGGRGDFAEALVACYEAENEKHFKSTAERAYTIADRANQEALLIAMLAYTHPLWTGSWQEALAKMFPGLAHLDEPTDNPHAIRLRREDG